ncbi:hypothetical protein FG91_00912 [Sphingopyxis sp. LC81]|jgi:hypothetical protein|uniref:DUF411 domain-containing protein n=1 Tax=Sphingopyxis sp. LC81 TaxID=1502850 RepID=UPI00050F0CBC|nr:DUF411 domain-containing protein [Sphingopyxis sp. LC81]KGB56028.1 hypothetical protein FG91_00912 [Sphingopyxis sp. LC81]
MKIPMTRRHLLGLVAAGSVTALAACSSASSPPAGGEKNGAAHEPGVDTANVRQMLVYRDPECGCCEAWADIARKAGYDVIVENRSDMAAVKARYGVPGQLASCHTAIIGGYAIEGHVPMRQVAKLLVDKPRNIRGIAVPGMPRGSPGMEMPDGSVDAFEVMAFGSDGKVSEFRA